MSEEKLNFQAEVTRLLDIVAHSLYSEKEIFLRELISNASDACDRLRYAALTEPHLLADDPDLKVVVTLDKKARTVAVADNGIGMPTRFERWMRSKLSATTALTPSSRVPLAAQSREEPVPYSLPATTMSGTPSVW